MPSVVIEVCREYPPAREAQLIEAVHAALVRAFGIPANDRHVRLLVHAPHRFACPPDKAQPDRYTQVSIDAFEGRSVEAKRRLYRQVVDSLEPLGIPRDHVTVIVRDLPRENWGIRGGVAACDLDLGFEVDV